MVLKDAGCRFQTTFAAAFDKVLGFQAIADQLGDRNHLEAVPCAELREMRNARHGAVGVHDFADHSAGLEAAHARQIDRGFGLPGAYQHAALPGSQREDVTGTGQVARGAFRIDGDANGV